MDLGSLGAPVNDRRRVRLTLGKWWHLPNDPGGEL
jgi:hypothetical protein